ncbi:MAG: TonB family protein [Dokdonella sp.]
MSDLLTHVALSALSSSAAIGLVLATRTIVARYFGAPVAYALWTLVPLAALAVLLPARTIVVFMRTMPSQTALVAASQQTTAAAPSPSAAEFDPSFGLIYVWLAGAIATWLIFVWRQRRFVRGLGRLEALHGGVHRAQATRGCPVLVGVWRPRIVVPADFETRYTPTQRDLILAHERQHLARGDAAANALATFLRSVFWFNPLLHFTAPYFLEDQELACDAAVIARFPHARRAYADALIKTQLGGGRAALACHWRTNNTLLERVGSLAMPSVAPSRRRIGHAAVTATVLAAMLTAWAARPAHTEVREQMAEIESPPSFATGAVGGTKSSAQPISESAPRRAQIGPRSASPAVVDRASPEPRKSPVMLAQTRSTPASVAGNRKLEEATVPSVAVQSNAGTDSPPRTIPSFRRDYSPAYPAAAARTHLEGSVVLDVHVDANGTPLDARVAHLEPPTANELASASLAAVTHWRFEPAQRNGRAVDGHLDVPFAFALDGPSEYAAPESYRQASYRSFGAAAVAPDAVAPDAVVYVRVRIEEDGRVSASAIERVDPASARALEDAALAALKTWAFTPAREREKPVASTAIVPVVFGADPRATPPIARLRNLLDPVRVTPTRG